MTVAELLCSTLHSLIEVTESLYESVERDDLLLLHELLDRRANLIAQQSKLDKEWKELVLSANDYQYASSKLRPLVEILDEVDKKIVTLLTVKKQELAEKIKQAQNQKRLLAYSR